MLKIAIVDNDREQIDRLSGFVKRYSEEKDEPCVCTTYTSGIDFIDQYHEECDVVFLDIDMPLFNGIETAEELRAEDSNVSIVFVTNHVKYAVSGYKVGAMDFLVKPVDYFEFSLELSKISKNKQSRVGDFIWVTSEGLTKRIAVMDIYYIEIVRHNIYIHAKEGVVSYRGTLKELEAKLDSKIFSRCHNSFVVNLHYVSGVKEDEIMMEKDIGVIYISRNRKKEFMAQLTSYIATNGGYTFKGENQ